MVRLLSMKIHCKNLITGSWLFLVKVFELSVAHPVLKVGLVRSDFKSCLKLREEIKYELFFD